MERRAIGRRIERARQRLGLSTQQLAQRIDKSQATVSRIENGKQGVTLELLAKIARVLQVHPFALLTDAPLRHAAYWSPALLTRADRPLCMLRALLRAGRERANLSRDLVARQVGLQPAELEAIEQGWSIPTDTVLTQIAELCDLDVHLLRELAMLERDHPHVSQRMALMASTLEACRQALDDPDGAEPDLQALRERLAAMAEAPADAGVGAMIEAGETLSLAHLSDRLLRLLQEPTFHQQVERMARVYSETHDETPTPPDAPHAPAASTLAREDHSRATPRGAVDPTIEPEDPAAKATVSWTAARGPETRL